MMDEVRRYLLKAEHALEVAEDLLKGGHAPDAAHKCGKSLNFHFINRRIYEQGRSLDQGGAGASRCRTGFAD